MDKLFINNNIIDKKKISYRFNFNYIRLPVIILLILTILFSTVSVFMINYEKNSIINCEKDKKYDISPFSLNLFDNTQIYPWLNNDTYYVFLPSYIEDLSQVNFELGKKTKISINGKNVGENSNLNSFLENIEYSLNIDGKDYKFIIMRSANVGTMYINTIREKDFNKVYKSKEYSAQVNINLYDKFGDVNCAGSQAEIHIRGNSTSSLDKKPFTIKLQNETEMLGMAASKKWVLLANGYDQTNLRNKIVYDFAQNLDFEWTPSCEYVDVYLNGEYNGLYLLTEKIEVEENRLNIDNCKEEFLIVSEWEAYISKYKNQLSTNGKKYFAVCSNNIENDRLEQINKFLNDLESYIKTYNNKFFEFIDKDSWIDKYILDEIFENLDGNFCSNYYYINLKKLKVKSGPIWDYDMSIGNLSFNDYRYLLSKRTDWRKEVNWYEFLYNNELFYDLVIYKYKDRYQILIQDLLGRQLDLLSEEISKANDLNYIRWKSMFDSFTYTQPLDESIEYVKNYLSKRIDFLNAIWIDNKELFSVQIKISDTVYSQNIEYGSTVSNSIDHIYNTYNYLNEDTVWIDEATGETYDINSPVLENKSIYALIDVKTEEPTENISIIYKIKNNILLHLDRYIFISTTLFITSLFVIFLVIDYKKNK